MKKILLSVVLFATALSVLLGSNQAYATTFILSDQASCEAPPLFGIWDGSGVTKTCTINSDTTIPSGDLVRIDAGNIALINSATLTNDGAIEIRATSSMFSSPGPLNNNGGITVCRGLFTAVSVNNYGIIRVPNLCSGPLTTDGRLNIFGTSNNFGTILVDSSNGRLTTTGILNNYGSITIGGAGTAIWQNGLTYNFLGGNIHNEGLISPPNNLYMAGGRYSDPETGKIIQGPLLSIFCGSGTVLQNDRCVPDGSPLPELVCGPNTFESGGMCLPVSSLAFCGEKTIQIGQSCVPNILAICSDGTTADENVFMCFAQTMGSMIGGTLLDIDTTALLVASIGTNPVLTGLVGITLAGVMGQVAWFVHKRKKKIV